METFDENKADTGRKGEPYPSPHKSKLEISKAKSIGFYLFSEDYEKFGALLAGYDCDGNISQMLRKLIRDMYAYQFEGEEITKFKAKRG